jgi:hypothetical protein
MNLNTLQACYVLVRIEDMGFIRVSKQLYREFLTPPFKSVVPQSRLPTV